ncbi:MAG: aminodeoxychorismate/anthranilate synthase component II [Prevotellaceae bacterium]|jgi:anthranilate synthase component 2|nr:aminodeoxychorismate/anthranilate synthase component II [Prevotellaceae bacterium]
MENNCQSIQSVIIDNYDSFTYNLVHLMRELGHTPDVLRNDKFALADLAAYSRIILSPGPGIPEEAGLLLEVIRTYAADKAILGICLGHQAIGQVFGAKLKNLEQVYHGVQTPVRVSPEEPLFAGLPSRLSVGRYHSWVVDAEGLPECLEITADDAEGHIMALRHRTYNICGVQFHPESVLTPTGKEIMNNWLNNR